MLPHQPRRRLLALANQIRPRPTEAGGTAGQTRAATGNNTTRIGSWKDQSQLGNAGLAVGKAPTGTVRGIAAKITVEPLKDRTLGAVIRGCSLANDDLEDPEAWEKVYQAFLDHAVLIFPDQHGLTTEQQGSFAERFAPIKHHLTITNIKKDGSLQEPKANTQAGRAQGASGGSPGWGTEGWHTDVTFTPISVTTGQLCAGANSVVPRENSGGETEFCDMRAGYDCLDDETKAKIENMVCYHSLNYGLMRRTGVEFEPTPLNHPVPTHDNCYIRPVVKVHPVTKRKTLLPTCFCFGIPGLPREESTKLLDFLCNNAAQAPRLYKHTWKEGDLVIWDERSTFHRSIPYDPTMPRRLFGVRTIGGVESEGALPAPDAKLKGTGEEAPNGQAILAAELAALKEEKPWEKIQEVGSNGRGGW